MLNIEVWLKRGKRKEKTPIARFLKRQPTSKHASFILTRKTFHLKKKKPLANYIY